MQRVEGDIIELAVEGKLDVLVHGCNCQNAMGRGLARQIRKAFPEAYDEDQLTVPGSRAKLGQISVADVVRGEIRFWVVNAYTQFHWRGVGKKTDYEAVRNAMRLVRVKFAGKRIAYPRIGAGLGGGDWDAISSIIDGELIGEQHTLVELPRAQEGHLPGEEATRATEDYLGQVRN